MPVVADASPSARILQRLHDAVGPWQPLTGRGLAAFAVGSTGRVLFVQGVFAALIALAATWSVARMVFPAVQTHLPRLPETPASIRDRQLHWPGTHAVLLVQCPQFAIAVDPESSGDLGLNGDIQLELQSRTLTFRGLLGETTLEYPAALDVPLDRIAASAAWGAWQFPMLALIFAATFGFTLLSWWLVAAIYLIPAWLMCRLIGKDLSATAAWRLSSAALWPAALLPMASLLLYATLWIRLPGLVVLWLLHFPAGWCWLAWGAFSLPRSSVHTPGSVPNPFSPADPDSPRARARTPGRRRNPFTR